jgi:hypothetical protein
MDNKYASFYDYMKTYDSEELSEITKHGCVSGCAGGLIYYSDTCAFYDAFDQELHDKLGEWIDEIGETPEFITKELGYANGFKNALVWFVAEQYAGEILQTRECEV